MSDARSLLRQQRQARRITHAYASYSDAGKLLCIACREPVKTEALWDSHVKGEPHLQRVAQLERRQKETAAATTDETTRTTSTKRKHTDDEDEQMDGVEGGEGESGGDDDSSAQGHAERSRRKRSRPDLSDSDSFKDMSRTPPPVPSMTRRSSGTPSQGVELQIPSRPATPRATSSSSANGTNGANGSAHSTTLPSRQASTIVPGPPLKSTTEDSAKQQPGAGDAADTTTTTTTASAAVTGAPRQALDEDEWAAFEAEIEAKEYAAGATISKAAMTSEEIEAAARAKAEAEEAESSGDPRQRKTQREMDLRDEKEDAQRALEEELDEMQSLEAKVMRLKQQRDALKQRAAIQGAQEGSGGKAPQRPAPVAAEKENVAVIEEDEDEDDDDDEEDEDDDGWDGFRFRTGVASRS